MADSSFADEIARTNPAMLLEEADFLLAALTEIDVRYVLEIGTHNGGSARMFRDVVKPDLLITVDWNENTQGDMSGIKIVSGLPSQHPLVLDTVRRILGDRQLDFLYIDGGHQAHEVLSDWLTFAPLVRRGGLIAFHDITVKTNEYDVRSLWESLCENDSLVTSEFVPKGGTGVGLVHVIE